ncbi:hypothetical protein F183_A24480 [Bryobacterales bacterium F-183]|nr:hypothetical protein F183_A24480 [Bryobacterales bacterium F-183]
MSVEAATLEEQETVYIPARHKVEDLGELHNFMDEFAFVDLITTTPSLHITHIPVLLDRTAGNGKGTIFGHIAKANPQTKAFFAGAPATIVFHGPHTYISPAWYTNPMGAVPTWNFAAVHASGKLKAIDEPKQLHGLLAKLVAKFEKSYVANPTYDFAKLPEAYITGMLGGIVGFELPIDTLEGKFKLGQERSDADKEGVLSNLKNANHERDILSLTASFYKKK